MILTTDLQKNKEKRLELLAMLYKDPILCGQYLFPHHFFLPIADWHISYINFLQKRHKYSLAVAPRGHAKTTTMQFYHILPEILFKRSKFILIISNTYDQASKILEAIKYELVYNPKILSLFGKLKGDIWRENAISTTTGVFIQIAGSDQKIRGFKYRENRPDLIFIDDLENDENVKNEDQRQSLVEWFYSAVLPAISTNGRIIVTGTILHYDSLLMKLSASDMWQKVWYSAIVDEDKKLTLWEEHLDWQKLMELKQSYASAGLLDQFNCEYLNDPIPAEAGAFKKEYFRYFTDSDIDIKRLNVAIITDFAIAQNRKSDYSVVMACGMDEKGAIYCLDYLRFRGEPDEIIKNVFDMCEKYNTIRVGIEVVAFQKIMSYILKEEMRKRNKYLNIVEMKQHRQSKEQRIETELQPRFKAGNVYHRKWMTDLESELLHFPKSKHDDIIDCLHRAPEILRLGKKIETPKGIPLPRAYKSFRKYPLTARF